MKLLIVTDAWLPQVNGVVNALKAMVRMFEGGGHDVRVISPDQFRSVPCPTYPEIRLALTRAEAVGARIRAFAPDAIHIATEGPLCLAARRWCVKNKVPFSTSYCTHFPDYVSKRTGLPARWFWGYFRWFHRPAGSVMASTPSLRAILGEQGLEQVRPWGRGVDLANFDPQATPPEIYAMLKRPIMLYVGRVAVEKNLEAFLSCDHPGSKVIVGDGPARAALSARYPDVHFLGVMSGRPLAGAYAGADVFVFPSLTDTFGVVTIEAMACGTPVAAFPVPGPADNVTDEVGALRESLKDAIAQALTRDRETVTRHGQSYTWEVSARQFLDALHPVDPALLRG